MKNHIKDIIYALIESKVEFIIGGGVAAVLQGVERVTMDLDLAVNMHHHNLSIFIDVMKNLKLVPRVPIPAEMLLDPEKVDMMIKEKNALVFTFIDIDFPVRQVDLFLKKSHSYEILKNDADLFEIEGKSFNAISKKKLIELKKSVVPPRKKDLWDIEVLENLIKNNRST